MSITKKYLKSKPVCKVTFKLSKELANGASSVHLVGDFNGWDTQAEPMEAMKSGAFSATLDLEQGKEYQFRYLLDGAAWANDDEADKYVSSPFSDAQNAVVIV
ncbi:MAG: isoamylase early set domain-containing protein [Bacteroidia bacterium]|jgi:1,4-alpha-glucan branching enzyme|nr:isoamylase early set domain-containing protein [Bacteroidia bacterium]